MFNPYQTTVIYGRISGIFIYYFINTFNKYFEMLLYYEWGIVEQLCAASGALEWSMEQCPSKMEEACHISGDSQRRRRLCTHSLFVRSSGIFRGGQQPYVFY